MQALKSLVLENNYGTIPEVDHIERFWSQPLCLQSHPRLTGYLEHTVCRRWNHLFWRTILVPSQLPLHSITTQPQIASQNKWAGRVHVKWDTHVTEIIGNVYDAIIVELFSGTTMWPHTYCSTAKRMDRNPCWLHLHTLPCIRWHVSTFCYIWKGWKCRTANLIKR